MGEEEGLLQEAEQDHNTPQEDGLRSACIPGTPGTAGQSLGSLQPGRARQQCSSSPAPATFPSTGDWAMNWFGRNFCSLKCAGWVQCWPRCLDLLSHGVSG